MPVGVYGQDLSQKQVFNIDRNRRRIRQHHQTQRKHGRKQNAYGSVRIEAGTPVHNPDQHGDGDPGGDCGYRRV